MTIPPTPPPDIDVEAWHQSIATVRAWRPDRLAVTHFGVSEDVDRQLDELGSRLDAWSELARSSDREAFEVAVQAEITRLASADLAQAYTQASPVEHLYAGYERYWTKRAQRA